MLVNIPKHFQCSNIQDKGRLVASGGQPAGVKGSSAVSCRMSVTSKSTFSRQPSSCLVSRNIAVRAVQVAEKQKTVTLSKAIAGSTTLGFLGIGIMGLAMAKNLLKAGFEVVVWNRNPEKCAPLVEAGAKLARSPKEVAQRATYTFAMLADPQAVLNVVLGPEGSAQGLSPGKGYIDVSTVDAVTSRQVSEAVAAAGAAFLEAPVSGSKGPAEQGKLVFLTAGDQALYEAVSTPLEVMGKASFFLGDTGAGADMKLVVNMLMGGMMACFAEALTLAKKSGLSQKDLVDLVALGAVASPMFALKGPSMAAGSFAPAFPTKHQQKDLRLALDLGDKHAQPLPMAAAANALYIKARGLGHGDNDFSSVIEALK